MLLILLSFPLLLLLLAQLVPLLQLLLLIDATDTAAATC